MSYSGVPQDMVLLHISMLLLRHWKMLLFLLHLDWAIIFYGSALRILVSLGFGAKLCKGKNTGTLLT